MERMISDPTCTYTPAPAAHPYAAIINGRRRDDALRAIDPDRMIVIWRGADRIARSNVLWRDVEYGYVGDGPRRLAQAIMTRFGRPDLTHEFHQQVVARITGPGAALSPLAIRLWIVAQGTPEMEAVA